jgi:hypothetical protein
MVIVQIVSIKHEVKQVLNWTCIVGAFQQKKAALANQLCVLNNDLLETSKMLKEPQRVHEIVLLIRIESHEVLIEKLYRLDAVLVKEEEHCVKLAGEIYA